MRPAAALAVAAGSAPAATLESILAVSGLVVVLVGPGILLLFWLRGRGKLSEEDERDVTQADLPGLRAAAAARSPDDSRPDNPGRPMRAGRLERVPGPGREPAGLAEEGCRCRK